MIVWIYRRYTDIRINGLKEIGKPNSTVNTSKGFEGLVAANLFNLTVGRMAA